MGQVVGSTSGKGDEPKDRPLTPADFLATVYRHLGIDPRHEFTDPSGRPHPTERGRERVAATVAQARREYAAGQCRPMTAADILREAQS